MIDNKLKSRLDKIAEKHEKSFKTSNTQMNLAKMKKNADRASPFIAKLNDDLIKEAGKYVEEFNIDDVSEIEKYITVLLDNFGMYILIKG